MKPKSLLWTAFVAVIGIVWLAWCQKINQTGSIDSQTAWKQFTSSSLFSSPVKQGRWYEGKIRGEIEVGENDGRSELRKLKVDGRLGFGGDSKQHFLHYKGVIWSYNLSMDRLWENGDVYVRSDAELISGAIGDSFVETLLGKITQTKGEYVYLRGFMPYQWIGLITQPDYVFALLSDYLSFDTQYCDREKCQIILDTDLLLAKKLWVRGADNKLFELLKWVNKQKLYFYPQSHKFEIAQLSMVWQDIQGVVTSNMLDINYITRWLADRVYNIKHVVRANNHTIDFVLDQEGETIQSRRSYYELYPDGWNLTLDSMLSWVALHLEWEWFDLGTYLPIDKGNPIDVYGLLGG